MRAHAEYDAYLSFDLDSTCPHRANRLIYMFKRDLSLLLLIMCLPGSLSASISLLLFFVSKSK